MARSPEPDTVTGRREFKSVIKRIRDDQLPASTTRPIRPSPDMTAMPSRTPSTVPAVTIMLRTKGAASIGDNAGGDVGQTRFNFVMQ